MAKQQESISGYFRPILKENPKLLKGKSNREIFERWLADHPKEKEVPGNVKGVLSNLKSVMRKQARKRGRKPGTRNGAPVEAANQLAEPENAAEMALEALEVQIDECIMAAKSLDREGLKSVINLLRRARNEIVWKIGQ
jgi:hypothetical protein